MSDKSFGDHMSRGVVKNPLLSTAVIGLSIDDLTQNAVLLPVSRSQELFGRQEPAHTLADTPSPSGDATPAPASNFTPINPPQPKKDDFDVNEYFARLQGTRYVSAPINSHIEDANANIEKEENLEEINLNEPEDPAPAGLTADIAQNFSQLPTVLPQVASAVFSSFSNMLSMKSKEHTPEVRAQMPMEGVSERAVAQPLMGVSEREVAPPPREPPITAGPGNFRLPTKKKYAQIPGLSSGEPTQMPTYAPPTFNQPIFTPPQQDNLANAQTNIPTFDVGQTNANFNVFSNTQSIPIDTTDNRTFEANVTTTQIPQETNQQGIIPPPPMFSNLAKRESLPSAGKTILPPSVARRIGSNKPTISNQAPAFASVGNIFVPTPAEDTQAFSITSPDFQANLSMGNSFAINAPEPSQPLPSVMPPMNTVSSAIFPPNESLASTIPPSSSEVGPPITVLPPKSAALPPFTARNLPPPPRNTFGPPTTRPQAKMPSTTSSDVFVAPPPTFPERTPSIPPPSSIPLFANVPSLPKTSTSVITNPPQNNIYLQEQPTAIPTDVSAQNQSQATAKPVNKHVSILSKNLSDEELRQMFNMPPVAEPPKIPQPPKASGNTNFRMTKKRPQYYSGPIEGVGAISNNIKPILTPAAPTAFQGAVFTPEANTGYQAAVLTPQVTENAPSSHGATLTTENITEHQKQFNMFSPVDVDVNSQFGSESVCATYNTSFDLSRQPTNTYDPPKQETGFGIIGSLKSKLSSIDINKLQNSVTTFFDPAYNTGKTETVERNQHEQNQGIFVPNPETHPQPYNYDAHQTTFTYGQGAIPNASDYYNQQAHNMYSTNSYYSQPSYGTQNYSQTDMQVPQTYDQHATYITGPTTVVDATTSQIANMVPCEPSTSTSYSNDIVKENKTGSTISCDQKLIESFGSTAADSSLASNVAAFFQGQLESNKPEVSHSGTENIEGAMNNLQIGDASERDDLKGSDIFSSLQDQQERDVPEASDAQKEKIIEDAIKNLQGPNPMSRAEIKAKAQEWNWTEEQIALNFISSPFANQFGELSEKAFRGTGFVDMLDHSKQDEELMRENRIDLERIYSAPLHALSSIIANRANEISDGVSEPEVSWNSNEDEVDDQSAAERLIALTDADSVSVSDDEGPVVYESGQTEDLNICETCREYNSPEENDSEEDLTHLLIKNITAPIQLSNAVEVPLTETHSNGPDDFDRINPCAEISLIADETIETLQIQSAAELLDDNESPNSEISYGWRTEAPLPPGQDLLDHDYSFTPDPNSIGFFGNNKLFFDNLPDYASEMKLKTTLPPPKPPIKPLVLEREMSIPSAPPAEDSDEPKSDEASILDVQSIEQDASKDFPVFEEYVIEPSEMEDEKLDLKDNFDHDNKNNDVRDTFTNRVDRFKKLEGADDASEQKDTNVSNSNSMMPSYFDTGNYAAESHFKNSLTSPTIARIPPGFEDFEQASRELNEQYEPRKTPDTSTQTQITTTISNAPTRTENLTYTVFSSISGFSDQPAYLHDQQVQDKLPAFASVFGAKIEDKDTDVPYADEPVQITSNTSSANAQVIEGKSQENKTATLANPVNLFASVTQITGTTEGVNRLSSCYKPIYVPTNNPHVEIEKKSQENEIVTLPDPINFFGSSTQGMDTTEEGNRLANYIPIEISTNHPQAVGFKSQENNTVTFTDPINLFASTQETNTLDGVNRLTSYKPMGVSTNKPQVVEDEDKTQDDNTVKLPDPINFFASSTQETVPTESVNRLASYFASPAKTDNTKSFFELSQGQDHYRQKEEINTNKTVFDLNQSQDNCKEDIPNIPHGIYIANLNLMKDLTSLQNIEPAKDQTVRTVNYFTIEYDSNSLHFNNGEPSINLKQPDIVNKENEEIEETIHKNDDQTEVVNKCKYCRDLKAGPVLTIREIDFDSIGKAKFRQAMDTASSTRQEVNMQPERETERSVNVRLEDIASDGDNSEGVAMLTENRQTNEYEPVKYHWFYRVDCEDKSTWRGFSNTDSRAIENAFQSPTLSESTLVPTDGGRFDVNVIGRLRTAVYWADKPTNVRRCSWFYKGTTDARYVPYTEAVAEKLEVEYRHGMTTGEWHRRLVLPNSELVVMHGPAVMVHFLQAGAADAFSAPNLFTFGKRVYRNPPKFKLSDDLPQKIDHLLLLVHGAGEWKHQKEKIQSTMRPRVVRRGIDESEIEDTEPSSIDHLLLLCHGVGSACDMRFRSVEEVVDDFRATSLQLLQSHYRNSYENGIVGRVEVLPISWHASLHAGPAGVDRRLARVTLASIPRLRNFTNDTVLDVLFYTSPHYCQMILDTVCGELNRIHALFMARNPEFRGQVSLGGHSLGSVILYDLLCNQPTPMNPGRQRSEKTYISGTAAKNPIMHYPKLCFEPLSLYALGSPIAIFECIRGVESLGSEFYLPTCRNFFNIFHPYDPIAYRIEPLVNPQLQNVKPSLIPHHKGRKRMHLELKDTMARVGADLKQKLVESIKNTWSSMWSSAAPPDHQLEKVVEEEIEKERLEEEDSKEEPVHTEVPAGELLGRLNGGRRVDHVLQEAPLEMINEYLFAMSSHVCYWESEDVMLLILREIYDSMGVQPDVTVPQQSMTVQRTTVINEVITVNSTDASTSRTS